MHLKTNKDFMKSFKKSDQLEGEEKIFLKGMFCSGEKMYFGEAWGSIENPKEAAEKLADIIRRQINE